MLLNETENEAADKFAMQHYRKHGKTAKVTVRAKQTGIGWAVEVECPRCKERQDITDSSRW